MLDELEDEYAWHTVSFTRDGSEITRVQRGVKKMAKFKVGDVVRYVGKEGVALRGDKNLIIVNTQNDRYYYRTEQGNEEGGISIENAEEVGGPWEMMLVGNQTLKSNNQHTQEKWDKLVAKIKEESNMNYEFNVSSPSAIMFGDIIKDLTRNNPVAKVEFIGDNKERYYYLVIHDSVLAKASMIGIYSPNGTLHEENVVFLEHPAEYKDWIQWIHDVRDAEWDDLNRGKVVVTSVEI